MKILNLEITAVNKPIKTRIYVFIENETVLENLEQRHNRPHKAYKPLVCAALIERGLITSPSDLAWSRTAGCGCGCSPGFILKNHKYGQEVFIDVDGGAQ